MPLVKPNLPKLKSVSEPVFNPQLIRNLGTGIGQTQQRSEKTGHERSECVRDCMPPGVASKASGYPARNEDMMEGVMSMPYGSNCLDAPLNYKKRT